MNDMTMLSYDVFISYSRKDKDKVDEIVRFLGEKGVHVWLDRAEINDEQAWTKHVAPAIATSKLLLLMVSKDSLASDPVIGELRVAKSQGLPILPILLDGSEIPAETNLLIGSPTWVDAQERDEIIRKVRTRVFAPFVVGSSEQTTMLVHSTHPIVPRTPCSAVRTYNVAWPPPFVGTSWIAGTKLPLHEEAREGGMYQFSCEIDLPCGVDDIASADLELMSDDGCEVFADGLFLGRLTDEDSKHQVVGVYPVRSFVTSPKLKLEFKLRNRSWEEIAPESSEPYTSPSQNPYGINFRLTLYHRDTTGTTAAPAALLGSELMDKSSVSSKQVNLAWNPLSIKPQRGRIIANSNSQNEGFIEVPLLFKNETDRELYVEDMWLLLEPSSTLKVSAKSKFQYNGLNDNAATPTSRNATPPDFCIPAHWRGTKFVTFTGRLVPEERNSISSHLVIDYSLEVQIDGDLITYKELQSRV